jgi:dipeptide transport system substrate-binding protein
LLAKAGLKDGFQTTIWTRPSGSLLNPNPSLGAQLLQSISRKSASRRKFA